MKTKMHNNSLGTYDEEKFNLSKRSMLILEYMTLFKNSSQRSLTDREIQSALGFSERGMVQPRITELIGDGLLEEVGRTKCRVTGKNVRLVSIAGPKHQTQTEMEL